MNALNRFLSCAVVFVSGYSAWATRGVDQSEPTVLFEDDFTNYGDTAAGVTPREGIRIGNDPIWTCSGDLSVRPISDFTLYEKPIPLAADGRFDFRFDFRILNGETNNPSGFNLLFGNGMRICTVPVTAEKIAGVRQDPVIPNWTWKSLLIKSAGDRGDVYLASDRKFAKIGEVKFGFKPTEVNFGVNSNHEFSVTRLKATTPGAVPAYPAAAHFASFKSLMQPLAGAKAAPGQVTLDVAEGQRAGVAFQADGVTRLGKVTVTYADGTKQDYPLDIAEQTQSLRSAMLGKKKKDTVVLPDCGLKICGAIQHVRPNLKMFQSSYSIEPQGIDILRDWELLPPASRHVYTVHVVRRAGRLQLWIDGSYAFSLEYRPRVKKGEPELPAVPAQAVSFDFAAGVKYANCPAERADQGYTQLDFAAYPRAKAFADGELQGVKAGETEFDGYPMTVARPLDSADISICHQAMGNWALEVEEYHGRSPLDGYPSAVHYRLPAAPYGRAGILFALDDDPAKDKILTLRLGHYMHNGSGGNMTDAVTLDFSKGVPESCREVGAVKVGGKVHKIYFMDAALNIGNIIDLTTSKDYLDFDVTGKQWENFQQMDNSMKPDPNSRSAFNLFGVTLKQTKYSFEQRQTQPGNVFTEDETNRTTTIRLKSLFDRVKGRIAWTACDEDGKEVFSDAISFKFAKCGDEKDVVIDFGQETGRGIYTLDIRAYDENNGQLFAHEATFAILPEKKRSWEMYKSPYATWWFNAHGSPGQAEIGFPIITKAGIRKASWREPTRDEQEQWGVTRCGNVMGLDQGRFGKFDPVTRQFGAGEVTVKGADGKKTKVQLSGEDRFVFDLKEKIARSTFVDHVMIWHESGPRSGIPEELLGLPVPEDTFSNRAKSLYMIEYSRIVRKHFPDLKIQMGNCSAAMGAAVWPLRNGASPDSFDYLGMESPAQVIPTERLSEIGLLGMLVSQDAASRLAKRKVRLNGAWEFTYRAERDCGEELQAEWHTRDNLVCLAHDFKLMSPGILFDCSTGYFNGLWGGAGLLRRAPYVYPKRAYVAYAVLTKVFDDVAFEKALPTGSGTAYAFQYKRADGKWVTALWFQRGEGEMEVESVGGTLTKMYGRESKLARGKTTVAVTGAPVYLTTARPLAGVKIVSRAFAQDMALAAKSRVASAMDKAELFGPLAPDSQIESTHHDYFPYLKPSKYAMETVRDNEKGECVEVRLDPANECKYTEYTTEYTTLRFKEPVAIEGEPELLGVWVKGNSNGGQLRFEIEDADGEIFKNLSTGRDWFCDIMDWPGNLAVGFDGWSFVYQTLGPTKLIPTHSPGPYKDQWVSCGGDKKIKFPIKVRAITVGSLRYLFTPLGFDLSKQIAEPIRLNNLSAVYR
jgi:hypothetical protein